MLLSDEADRRRLRVQLQEEEACVLHAYQDSKGWWTIGFGHLIDKRKGGSIPARIAFDLLDVDIDRAIVGLVARFPWVAGLNAPRQAALIDMTFNMGIEGLATFTSTLPAIERGDWPRVKAGILASKYHGDVGDRAVRIARQLVTGAWA